jgi:hypothetical protein
LADRLSIYRDAQRHLGTGRISSLSEQSETRLVFDDIWQQAGDYLLAKGMWNWAIRSVELSYDANVEPKFGYQYAFSQPDDFVRTVNMSTTGDFFGDLEQYEDEASYWYAAINPIYVSYVSNLPAYGWNVGRWTAPFAEALAAHIAYKSSLPIQNDKSNRNDLYQLSKRLLQDAKTLDAVDEAVAAKPVGRLVRSRFRYASLLNGRFR